MASNRLPKSILGFQFLGIPPKGERQSPRLGPVVATAGFQFLGIPPKGELSVVVQRFAEPQRAVFPISRDPPEGGTLGVVRPSEAVKLVSNF